MAKAATELGVSQPAILKIIADLEHALGVQLLDRNRRGIEPTIYGDALLRRGLVALDLPGRHADDEGENDRSLITSDTKPDRSNQAQTPHDAGTVDTVDTMLSRVPMPRPRSAAGGSGAQ
jgi:hypothetical protein